MEILVLIKIISVSSYSAWKNVNICDSKFKFFFSSFYLKILPEKLYTNKGRDIRVNSSTYVQTMINKFRIPNLISYYMSKHQLKVKVLQAIPQKFLKRQNRTSKQYTLSLNSERKSYISNFFTNHSGK